MAVLDSANERDSSQDRSASLECCRRSLMYGSFAIMQLIAKISVQSVKKCVLIIGGVLIMFQITNDEYVYTKKKP